MLGVGIAGVAVSGMDESGAVGDGIDCATGIDGGLVVGFSAAMVIDGLTRIMGAADGPLGAVADCPPEPAASGEVIAGDGMDGRNPIGAFVRVGTDGELVGDAPIECGLPKLGTGPGAKLDTGDLEREPPESPDTDGLDRAGGTNLEDIGDPEGFIGPPPTRGTEPPAPPPADSGYRVDRRPAKSDPALA